MEIQRRLQRRELLAIDKRHDRVHVLATPWLKGERCAEQARQLAMAFVAGVQTKRLPGGVDDIVEARQCRRGHNLDVFQFGQQARFGTRRPRPLVVEQDDALHAICRQRRGNGASRVFHGEGQLQEVRRGHRAVIEAVQRQHRQRRR